MKNIFKSKSFLLFSAVVLSALVVVTTVTASTTISTNIVTGGTLITAGKVAVATTSSSVSANALDVTGTTTSSTGVQIGLTGSGISQLLHGYCSVDFPSFASSTVATCTATGVAAGDKIFFTASSSNYIVINSASSTANTISFGAYNPTAAAINPEALTVDWMAFH